MLSNQDIDKVRSLPIEVVAERLGLKVQRHLALCPFHADRSPSLHFDLRRNRYRCFVCGAHGRAIDLMMGLQHLSFPEACRKLAADTNTIIEDHQNEHRTATKPTSPAKIPVEALAQMVAEPTLTDEAKAFLFDKRRLDPRVIQWCGISSTHTHLLIPYYDAEGKFLSVQWRSLSPNTTPRFKFPRGYTCPIYNLQILKHLNPSEPLYITEGASDCWAMLSSGHKAIAIPSATLLNPRDLEILSSPHLGGIRGGLYIYPDQDAAGERLYQELATLSSRLGFPLTRLQLPEGCKDYSEYYLKQLCHKEH